MKYEEALQQLQDTVAQIENNELDIDQLTQRLKESQQLIRFCKDTLYKTDEELKALLAEDGEEDR